MTIFFANSVSRPAAPVGTEEGAAKLTAPTTPAEGTVVVFVAPVKFVVGETSNARSNDVQAVWPEPKL